MQEVTKRLIEYLKEKVEKERFVDVGKGVAKKLLVSDERLRTAVRKLEEEDYDVTYVNVKSIGNPKTVVKILSKGEEFSKEMSAFAKKVLEMRKMS